MNVREKLLRIQTELKVPKNRSNAFGNFKYRSAEDILKRVKPFLSELKLTLTMTDEVISVGTHTYIKATAYLVDTESEEFVQASALAKEPQEAKAKMDESQTTGSASSYARKYALNGLFLLDDSIDIDSEQAIDDGSPCSDAQKKIIEDLCKQHNVNIQELYKKHKVKKDRPTASQAGLILNIFKKHFGD